MRSTTRGGSGIKHQRLDERWMNLAIHQAEQARLMGMRPFGTVIVSADQMVVGIGQGSETDFDPTRHSEVLAIQEACRKVEGLLHGCTLYQTHQPCHMCCGASKHAKLSRVVWGSSRSDLPQLFRQCDISAKELLEDTTNPPEIMRRHHQPPGDHDWSAQGRVHGSVR